MRQTFIDTKNQPWLKMEQFPGTEILALAEPVSEGSIHKLRRGDHNDSLSCDGSG